MLNIHHVRQGIKHCLGNKAVISMRDHKSQENLQWSRLVLSYVWNLVLPFNLRLWISSGAFLSLSFPLCLMGVKGLAGVQSPWRILSGVFNLYLEFEVEVDMSLSNVLPLPGCLLLQVQNFFLFSLSEPGFCEIPWRTASIPFYVTIHSCQV